MTAARDSELFNMAETFAPQWRHSLHVKFAALLVLLALLISLGAMFSGRWLVLQPLVADEFRYERESGLRLTQTLDALAREAELAAGTLARLVASQSPDSALSSAPPRLIDAKGRPTPFSGVGLWLEPDASGKAHSRYWQRDGAGVFREREEYHDPSAAPYWKESWYTPARYAQEDRCYWTPPRVEPLSRVEITSCALPVRNAQGFAGVVTLELPLAVLGQLLSETGDHQDGYSLLLDNDNRLLAVTRNAATAIGGKELSGNLAGLAQRQESYNPLALALHRQQEQARSQVARSPLYDAAAVSALERNTRALSRTDAETALLQLWAPLAQQTTSDNERLPGIDRDPVLKGTARTTLFAVPSAPWQLLRVTSADSGLAAIEELFALNVLVSAGIFVLLLIAAFLVLSYWVVRPLRRMAQELAASPGMEDAMLVTLDESSRDEVGTLAHWYNERTRQLRELVAKAGAATAQLSKESGERRSALDQATRAQDCSIAIMATVHDAVLLIDERGQLETMNPVAETLLGVSAGAARGRPLSELFELRHADVPLPDLSERAHALGGRLEYRDAITLVAAGGTHAVEVAATPLHNRAQRKAGTVIVLREHHVAAEPAATPDTGHGLPGRMALDRRVRALLDAARVVPRTHSLLLVDVDHLRQINETAGRAAGDEVLAHLGELLRDEAQRLGEVFRIGRDQFALVLENIDSDSAQQFAEELRAAIAARPLHWSGQHFTITVSIGVTPFSASDESPIMVLEHADSACAGAKGAGRNQVRIYTAGVPNAAAHRDDSLWVRRSISPRS
jgi:diguanylate cyclase (GGDEF)-like protein/PAS domain S-box-containing protein